MTSTKFKVGDPVKLAPSGTEIYVISHVHVKYGVTHPKFVGTTGLHEEELYELSTEEQAMFKKEKTEVLKKKMLAAIAEYEAFLKN